MEAKNKNMASSVFIETYGCQMNKYDSELVAGILHEHGYHITEYFEDADIILVNTCSVRNHAEQRVLGRLQVLRHWKNSPNKKIGVIGCMAQRMGSSLFDHNPDIDFILGPDAYRDLPQILTGSGQYAARLDFNTHETYDGIYAYRKNSVSGWITVMRGCNNFCSYCIVPYTRGRERSRSVESISREITNMTEQGFREITLLGQNVNSYQYEDNDFPELLIHICRIPGIKRIRFMTSHPKDLSDRLIQTIAEQKKICSHIHLPVQSGSNRILNEMNRRYTREQYLDLIHNIRKTIPGVAVSSDVMVGFPGESETDFQDTIRLLTEVQFDEAFTYYYSPREGTKAAAMPEMLTEKEKKERLNAIINIQKKITIKKKQEYIGTTAEVLAETESRKSKNEWMGKTDTNHVVIFPKMKIRKGEIVPIRITECAGATLRGECKEAMASLLTP